MTPITVRTRGTADRSRKATRNPRLSYHRRRAICLSREAGARIAQPQLRPGDSETSTMSLITDWDSTSARSGHVLSRLRFRMPRRPLRGQVEAVEVHHLGPRRHEVLDELLLRVGGRVDLAHRPHPPLPAHHHPPPDPRPLP